MKNPGLVRGRGFEFRGDFIGIAAQGAGGWGEEERVEERL
jgi:hypothetical protein